MHWKYTCTENTRGGMTPPLPSPPHIAYDFLFVKSRGPQIPSYAPLSCFPEFVKLCAPGQMCKDNPGTLSTRTPSNSRDLHHMTSVTNQCFVTCIMWCISYYVTYITWSASRFSCCVSSLTYTCVTYIMWSPSPTWPIPYDLRHHRDSPHMIYVTMVSQVTEMKITRKFYRG